MWHTFLYLCNVYCITFVRARAANARNNSVQAIHFYERVASYQLLSKNIAVCHIVPIIFLFLLRKYFRSSCSTNVAENEDLPFSVASRYFLTRAIFVRIWAVSICVAHILRFAKFVYHEVDCVLMASRFDRNHWPTSKINGTHS